MKKLSPAMKRALAKITDKWQSTYELGESVVTLAELEGRGLIVCDCEVSTLRFQESVQWKLKK